MVLCAREREVTRHRSVLAYVLGWEGWVFQQRNRFEESWRCFEDAQSLYLQVIAEEPTNPDFKIALSQTEARMAVWHMHQRTVADDRAAAELLQTAEARLEDLRHTHTLEEVAGHVAGLLDNVRVNKQIVWERLQKGPESPPFNH